LAAVGQVPYVVNVIVKREIRHRLNSVIALMDWTRPVGFVDGRFVGAAHSASPDGCEPVSDARHINQSAISSKHELEGENYLVAIVIGLTVGTIVPAHAVCVVTRWTDGHEGQHPIFKCT
jgi:hypothetical protein